jgi:hypothetical protein
MNATFKKRFEELVAKNIEGISSTEENLELWRVLKAHPELKTDFFGARDTHYLLSVLYDCTASEAAFTNRIQNTLQGNRLSEQEFIAAIQNRLNKAVPKVNKRPLSHPALKIAASIILVFCCVALLKYISFQPETRLAELSKPADSYLAWNYEPEIRQLQSSLTKLYGTPDTMPYLYTGLENDVIEQSKQLNTLITLSENAWPWGACNNGI